MTTLAPSKIVTTRDPKGLKFVSIVETAYNKAGLSEEEAQRVNDTPGLADLVRNFINENRLANKFKNEEVRSSCTYPSEYKGPKPIETQIKAIAEIFTLDPASTLEFAKNLPVLPSGAEGWFAIPSIDVLAVKYFPEVSDPAEKYCRAVQLTHEKLGNSRSFYNCREGQIDRQHLKVHARTADALAIIEATQKGDILIIAAQLGMRHRGRSVRRAREFFAVNEFGLGALMVGSIALTHSERFACSEELDIDCVGDEWSPGGDGQFGKAPIFFFGGVKLGFDVYGLGAASVSYGSASAFLLQ